MPMFPDDDMVMHRNPQRSRNVNDRLGHVDVGARRRRVATWMIVHQSTVCSIDLIALDFCNGP
jgi:hypothetical protein